MKLINWFNKNKLLILVLVLGIFFRFYHLSQFPYPHVDEVMNAYVGKFTLLNKVDLYGNKLPLLYFNNFGDYPNIIPMYLSGLFVILFGVNEFAFRLPIAIFSVLSIGLVYFISNYLFKSKKAALFAAFSLAIMPWHIVLSRSTAEGVTAAFVFLLTSFIIFKNLDKKPSLKLVIAIIFNIFTYLLYPAYRIIVPLAFLPLVLLAKQKSTKIILGFFTLLSFGFTFLISQSPMGQGRFNQTSILSGSNETTAFQQEFITGEGNNSAIKARLLFNKPLMYGKEFIEQYLSYFSPSFLFNNGGLPMRYYVPDQGLIYFGYLLLIISPMLLWFLANNKLQNLYKKLSLDKEFLTKIGYLLYLTLVTIVPAALTSDDVPNVHRTTLLPLLLSVWFGFLWLFIDLYKYRLIKLGMVLVLLLETGYFWNKYLVHAGKYQEIYRDPATKEFVYFLNEKKTQYDRIYIGNRQDEPIYFLFYNNIYSYDLSTKFKLGLQIDNYENIFFKRDDCFEEIFFSPEAKGNNLYVMRPGCETNLKSLKAKNLYLKKQDMIKTISGNEELSAYTLEKVN